MTAQEVERALAELRERKRYKGKGDPRNPPDPNWEEQHSQTIRRRDAALRRAAKAAAKRFADLEARGQLRLLTPEEDAELRVREDP